jgi:hypothetical protein
MGLEPPDISCVGGRRGAAASVRAQTGCGRCSCLGGDLSAMMYITRERKMKSMDTATAQVHAELRSESM